MYKRLGDANKAILAIRPRVTLEQANEINRLAENVDSENGQGVAWPIAINQWKRGVTVRGGKWVARNSLSKKGEELEEMIKQENGKWVLYSSDGSKKLGEFDTKKEAEERERQIQYFKNKGESAKVDKNGFWVGLAEMSRICPACAVEMKKRGLSRVNVPALLKEAVGVGGDFPGDMPEQMAQGLCDKVGNDPGFHTHCKSEINIPSGWDADAFCAELHKYCLGYWPAQSEAEVVTLPSLNEVTVSTSKVPKLRALVDEFVVLVADALGELEPEMPTMPTPAATTEVSESGARMRGEMLARLADARKTLDEIHEWGSYAERVAQAQQAAQIEVFAESIDGSSITLLSETTPDGGRRAPVKLDVVLIKPGWGNKRDGHYYPANMLRRDAKVFEGAKMYATDHKPGEKSVRTEVSRVERIKSFRDDGAPIAEVIVFEPDFAEMVRNRADAGLLNTLECSILAGGKAKDGTIEGTKGKIVEAITSAQSVDWVTRAGAGGQAMKISESARMSEQEGEQPEKYTLEVLVVGDGSVSPSGGEYAAGESVSLEATPAEGAMFDGWSGDLSGTDTSQSLTMDSNKSVTATFKAKEAEQTQSSEAMLSEAERDATLEKTKLPSWAKDWLREANYSSEVELAEAIKRAVERVKKVTHSGQPFALGSGAAPVNVSPKEFEEQRKEKFNEIMRRIGMKEV